MKNFAIIGAAGYIAPRHMKAIKETGNRIVAAYDPFDSVGILDNYFLDTKYFKEFERFERFLDKLKYAGKNKKVHYVSICSPNYLHDVHARLAMSKGADVICEKPLTINPWNLKELRKSEKRYNKKIYNVLQLRLHPKIIELKERTKNEKKKTLHKVELTYITSRGNWYDYSWKGDEEMSGGVAMNIGVHFFDMLIWLFGKPIENKVYLSEKRRMSGYIKLKKAEVEWYLSLEYKDLPFKPIPGEKTTHRSMKIDNEEIDFTYGFTDLHTKLYEDVLKDKGFGISDVEPVIDLVYDIRNTKLSKKDKYAHRLL